MRQPLSMLCCMLLSSLTYADLCPSVQDLQSGKALHWRAFDSDNGKPLAGKHQARLISQIRQFALAEWSRTEARASIRCYYKNESGSHLEAYFARKNISPIQPSKYWYQVTGMMHCAAGTDKCAFQPLPTRRQQLARNDLGRKTG